MIIIQAVSFLKKKRISGLPERPALGARLLRQLTPAQGEEDPVTKHKGGPRAPYSNLQTLSLATGVFSEQFLHRVILFMLIRPGFGHWTMWGHRMPTALGEPRSLSSQSLGTWGNPAQHSHLAFPSGLCGLDPGQVSRWHDALATLFFGGPGMGVSSLEPLIRDPITPGELPTLHTDQVFGATRVTCGELSYSWPVETDLGRDHLI